MKRKLLYLVGMILALNTTAMAEEHEVTIISEIERLPNGEIPTIVVNPVQKADKVKSIEILPFIHGKAKVIVKLSSPTSPLNGTPLEKSGMVEIVSSKSQQPVKK